MSETMPDANAENDVMLTALSIARRAPKRQGQNVYSAHIPWSLIHELRRAFDELGIDWAS